MRHINLACWQPATRDGTSRGSRRPSSVEGYYRWRAWRRGRTTLIVRQFEEGKWIIDFAVRAR